MNEDDLEQMRRIADQIEVQSFRKNIDPSLFFLMLQCLCRTPLGSISKITSVLNMIRMLAENGMDYNLLLKAGILTGQFPDYWRFRQQRNKAYARSREIQTANAELEEMQKKLPKTEMMISDGHASLVIDISWLGHLRNIISQGESREEVEKRYRNWWNHLSMGHKKTASSLSPDKIDFSGQYLSSFLKSYFEIIWRVQENGIKEIQGTLNLDPAIWEFAPEPVDGDFECRIFLMKKTLPQEFTITPVTNTNPFDSHTSASGGTENVISYDTIELAEIAFITIFQKSFWSRWSRLNGVREMLEDYFVKRSGGRKPDAKEFEALRRRYYRFIQRAYHSDALKMAQSKDKVFLPVYHVQGYLELAQRKNKYTFRIRKRNAGQKGQACYFDAELFYDKNKRKYYLLKGSRLSGNIDEISDTGIAEFIEDHTGKSITKVDDGFYRVLKRIEVKSPSKAAWLVCGYKRNGLKAWKNHFEKSGIWKTQTLQQVLDELKQKSPTTNL